MIYIDNRRGPRPLEYRAISERAHYGRDRARAGAVGGKIIWVFEVMASGAAGHDKIRVARAAMQLRGRREGRRVFKFVNARLARVYKSFGFLLIGDVARSILICTLYFGLFCLFSLEKWGLVFNGGWT